MQKEEVIGFSIQWNVSDKLGRRDGEIQWLIVLLVKIRNVEGVDLWMKMIYN